MGQRMTAVGAAAGTVVAGMAVAGQAYIAQEQQVRGIQKSYGEASAELLKFADSMQSSTVYSDDAARAALLTASTITRQYGIATDQVDDLVMRSADLAAIFGFDLADATSRVTSAIRGEAEAAEALGIAMSDSALQAYAAAHGMDGWNTTMTEAEKAQVRFNVLMEQTAYAMGSAAEQANTSAGRARQWKNEIQDVTQSLGDALGPLGEYTAVLGDFALVAPLAGAGLGKLGSALAAMGLGGAAGGAALLALAGVGVTGYGLYSMTQSDGGSFGADLFGGILHGTGSGLDAIGIKSVGGLFQQIADESGNVNDLVDAVKQLFYIAPGTQINDMDTYAVGRLRAAGIIPHDFSGSVNDAGNYINQRATGLGMSESQYIQMMMPQATAYVFDPVSGQYVYKDTYRQLQIDRIKAQSGGGAAGVGRTTSLVGANYRQDLSYNPYGGRNYEFGEMSADYRRGGYGAVAMSGIGMGMPVLDPARAEYAARAAEAQRIAQMQGAFPQFSGIFGGMDSRFDAQQAFKGAQDSILGQAGVYGAQYSEYAGVASSMEAGYEILNKRKEEGIALSREEQAYLENYDELYGRVTGGMEDAQVQQALLNAQYAENMTVGDQMNQTLGETNGAITDLTSVLTEYLLQLDGIPPEVRTELLLQGADESIENLIRYYNWLNSIPGNVTTVVETQFVESGDGSGGRFRGAGMDGLTMYAGGGTHYGGNHALVGERGPELVWLPNGAQVMNTEGSRSRMASDARRDRGRVRSSGGDVHIHGPITVIANDRSELMSELRSRGLSEVTFS